MNSPAAVEEHLVLAGRRGGRTPLADWLAWTLEAGRWEVGWHFVPGTWQEHHAGMALMTDRLEEERAITNLVTFTSIKFTVSKVKTCPKVVHELLLLIKTFTAPLFQ